MNLSPFAKGAVIAALCIGSVFYAHYTYKINLYQDRLRETLDEIHRLQHMIDPTHARFNHAGQSSMSSSYGFSLNLSGGSSMPMDMGGMMHDMNMQMHDAPLDIADTDWRPTVSVEVRPDPMSGWNVHVITNNFRFAPENAGADHMVGEGHAHLYVDGIKLARMYGEWYHIAELASGPHDVKVTLNANSHRPLFVGEDGVQATQEFSVE